MTAYVQDGIVLLGDSITQGGWQANGFAQRLASDYARKLDVINRGLGGYNTEWAIPVFEQMVTSATSAWYSPSTKIILITPPPLNPHQWLDLLQSRDPPGEMDRTFENTAKYAQAVRDVGVKENIPVLDVFSALMDAVGQEQEGLENYLTDGLHLSSEGYAIVYDQLIETINKEYPELHYDNLKETFIPWDQVDRANVRASVTKRKN